MTPLVPLDTFRQVMQMSPLGFWGLANKDAPIDSACDSLVREYAWQGSGAGRSEIRDAMEYAETRLREQLGYSVAPAFVEESLLFPRYHDTAQRHAAYAGSDGRWIGLRLGQSRAIAVGVEKLTSIGTVTVAGGSLVFSDSDGDGLNDTFTITIATTVTDPNEIAVYFAAADRLDGEPVGDRWRIQPVKVRISGGTATIVGRYWLLVKPIKYQRAGLGALDPMEISGGVYVNIANTLEVYRHHCDPTGTSNDTAQALLAWETQPYPEWANASSTSTEFGAQLDPAALAYAIARVTVRDALHGIVALGEAVYNATAGEWSRVNMSYARPPDRVVVRYRAGLALVNGQADPGWGRVVSRYAAALIGRRICGCDDLLREFYHAQVDLAFSGAANTEKFMLDDDELGNPFGTRRGMVEAWRAVRHTSEVRGVLA